MTNVVYRPNPAGLRAMTAAPFMVNAIRTICERGQAAAEANTPVLTGRMKASWHTQVTIRDGRASGVIYNDAVSPDQRKFPYPRVVELGAHNQPRQRPLGRAIDEMAAGR